MEWDENMPASLEEIVNNEVENWRTLMKKERLNRGMTLKELANEINMSLPFMSDIERGDALPSFRVKMKIEIILGMYISDYEKGWEDAMKQVSRGNEFNFR